MFVFEICVFSISPGLYTPFVHYQTFGLGLCVFVLSNLCVLYFFVFKICICTLLKHWLQVSEFVYFIFKICVFRILFKFKICVFCIFCICTLFELLAKIYWWHVRPAQNLKCNRKHTEKELFG